MFVLALKQCYSACLRLSSPCFHLVHSSRTPVLYAGCRSTISQPARKLKTHSNKEQQSDATTTSESESSDEGTDSEYQETDDGEE